MAWTFVIGIWHGLHSVAVPLLIVHFFYPEAFERSWLSGKTFFILTFILVGLMSINFAQPVGEGSSPASVSAYAGITLLSGVPILLARCTSRRGWPSLAAANKLTLGPFVLGFFFMAFLVVAMAMSHAKVSLWIFFPVALAILIFFAVILAKKSWRQNPHSLLFGLGPCLSFAAFMTVIMIMARAKPIYIPTGICLILAEVLLAVMIRRMHNRHLQAVLSEGVA